MCISFLDDLDKAQTLTHELQLEKESIAQSKEKTAEELRESLSRLSEAEELTNEKEQAVIKLMQYLENMAVVQEDLKQKNIELTDILSQKQNEMARLLGEKDKYILRAGYFGCYWLHCTLRNMYLLGFKVTIWQML